MMVARYFSIEEYQLRWSRVEDEMRRRGIECAVVWGKTSASFDRAGDIIYLTNYFSHTTGQGVDISSHRARTFCAVLLQPGETPELHVDDPELRPELVATDRVRNHPDPVASIIMALEDRKVTDPIAFSGSDFFPVAQWERLVVANPQFTWRVVDDLVRSVRFIKTDRELDCFREGAAIVNPAMDILMERLIAGVSEAEAAGLAAAELLRRGGTYHKIVCTHGKLTAYTCSDPFTGYSTLVPGHGDLVRAFIIGPILQGYYFDPGRTAVVGNRPDREQRALIEGCAAVVESLCEAVRPGRSYKEIAEHGDRLVAEIGSDGGGASAQYPFYGHPNGLYFETPPYLSTVHDHLDAVIETNTVLGVEAFIAKDGIGTAGFEQNVIVNKDGIELLTTTPMIPF